MKAKLKVAVLFNEPNPELYRKPSKKRKKTLVAGCLTRLRVNSHGTGKS